jgi:DNA-binding MarR family transcriptional regulator
MSTHAIDRSPVHLLHRAAQAAEAIFQARMTVGLTPRQLAVLTAVADAEGLSQTAVVARTGIDRSSTTDIIRRLVRRGWLSRRRSRADTRANVLKLSEEGRRVLQAAQPLENRINTRVLRALPDARRDAFMSCLHLIVSALDNVPLRRTPPDGGRAGPGGAAQQE